jgi:hypothetical protein
MKRRPRNLEVEFNSQPGVQFTYPHWEFTGDDGSPWPNVSVKLGGMLNRGAAFHFRELPAPPNSETRAAAWRPYIEPCIELFGADRCSKGEWH